MSKSTWNKLGHGKYLWHLKGLFQANPITMCSEYGEVCPSSPAAEMGQSGFGEDIPSNVVMDTLVVFSLGEQSVHTIMVLQR